MDKNRLQELCQKKAWEMPKYEWTKTGPDHNPRFTASVSVNGISFQNTHFSRSAKEAQAEVARLAYDHFTSPDQRPSSSLSQGPLGENSKVDNETKVLKNEELLNDFQPNGIDMNFKKDTEVTEMLHLSKSQLQILAQKRSMNLPVYACVCEGPPHVLRFKATVNFGGQDFESPEFFRTRKEAEHAAARAALVSLSGGLHDEEVDSGLYKNMLREFALREGISSPIYKTTTSGASHMLTFFSTVEVEGEVFSGKASKTKKSAEMNAAKVALSTLSERRSMLGNQASSNQVQEPHQDIAFTLQSAAAVDMTENLGNKSNSIQMMHIGASNNSESNKAEEHTSHQISKENNARSSYNKSDMICARLRDPFPLELSCNENEMEFSSICMESQDASLPPTEISRKKSASGRMIQVYPRAHKLTPPEGAIFLPFSDDSWIALELKAPECGVESKTQD